MLSPNRIVAFLTPLVFAPLAGAIAAWVAENFPGVELSPERLTNIFIAGALIALAPALQWLHGWQKYEQRVADAQQSADMASAAAMATGLASTESAAAIEPDEELEELDDIEDVEPAEELDELDELEDLSALDDAELEELEDPLLAGEGDRAGTGS